MDTDGLDVSILYPTEGLFLFHVQDSELLNAVFRTYNDWIADHCSSFPRRLKGIGMLNIDGVQEGIREMERCAKMGLVGAMITVYPPEDRSYASSEYESLWAAAQDLGMPLSLHIGTNRPGPGQAFADIESTGAAFFSNVDPLGADVDFPHDLQRRIRALPQAAGRVS